MLVRWLGANRQKRVSRQDGDMVSLSYEQGQGVSLDCHSYCLAVYIFHSAQKKLRILTYVRAVLEHMFAHSYCSFTHVHQVFLHSWGIGRVRLIAIPFNHGCWLLTSFEHLIDTCLFTVCSSLQTLLSLLTTSALSSFALKMNSGVHGLVCSPINSQGVGYSTGIWVGGFQHLKETLTLLKTQSCKFQFCYPVQEKLLQFCTLFKTGTSITVFKTIRMCKSLTHLSKATENQRKLCGWGLRRGVEDLQGWPPTLKYENVNLYSLLQRETPENGTLSSRTSLY